MKARQPKPIVPCAVCGQPTTSQFGVCWRTAACQKEYNRQWYVSTPEYKAKKRERESTPQARAKAAERMRQWLSTPQVRARRSEYARRRRGTPEYKAKRRARQSTPEFKAKAAERKRRYRSKPENLAKERARRSKPENLAKERARRSKPENLAKERAQHIIRNRKAGRLPLKMLIGEQHPSWAGGKIVPCSVPGCPNVAGYRRPSRLKRFRPVCKEHRGYFNTQRRQ